MYAIKPLLLRNGRLCHFFLLLLAVNTSISMYASVDTKDASIFVQQSITGTVLDQNGQPIPGASVTLQGTTKGTVTDFDGNFTIEASSGDTLEVSFVGFQSQEIAITNQTSLNITLTEDVESLSEVVVIGYGSVKKSDLTGSVSSLQSDDFNQGAQTSANQLIQGRSAGVQITQSSAQPGGGFSVRVRGATSIGAGNEPLYVIDGLPAAPINALNPSDIQSIEVLKDASATAIYGSRGANGVILITTKQGKTGKLQVNYETYAGFQQVENKLDLLSGPEYASFINGVLTDNGDMPRFTPEELSAIGAGTDWQDELFRTAKVQNHQFSVSGGNEDTKFYASLNYYNQEGVVISSGIKRYTAKVNVSHTGERFNFGINLNTSVVQDDNVRLGNDFNTRAGVIGSALQYDPTQPVYDENGEYTRSDVDLNNPVALAETYRPRQETDRTFGTTFVEYEFVKGLSAKANLGIDRSNGRSDLFVSPATKLGEQLSGQASISQGKTTSYLMELTSNYEHDFGEDHSLTALLGVSYQEFNFEGFNAESRDFPSQQFGTNNLSAGNIDTYNVGSSRNRNQLLSYIGRANYIYKGRYLLTATIRADGSSRFGENNKYGYFPSVALGWRLSDEPFLEDSDVLSDLKLRGSYGVTGNQEIGNYTAISILGKVGDAVFNGSTSTAIAPLTLPNPDLKWEQTEQTNVGVDFGFFNNRLTGSADYYVKKTSDLLLSLPVPLTSGFGVTQANVGDSRNEGFEFLLESKNFVGDFKWSTSLNFSTVKNKVTNLGELPFIYQGNLRFLDDFTILKVGESLNSYFGYKTDGIFRSQAEVDASAQPGSAPGQIRFADINDDGAIDADDRVILGNPFPDFNVGLSNSFSYKGISLDVFFQGSVGNELLNFSRLESESPIELIRNRLRYVSDRWTPDNPNSPNPSYTQLLGNRAINDRVVEDASYLRLKNVRLGYSFPELKIKGIRSLSVFATAQNVFTITDYSGFNPDVNSFGNSNIRLDYNAYPLARTITLGFNIGF